MLFTIAVVTYMVFYEISRIECIILLIKLFKISFNVPRVGVVIVRSNCLIENGKADQHSMFFFK